MEVIESAEMELAAPTDFARRKDKSLRFYVDYRGLDAITFAPLLSVP